MCTADWARVPARMRRQFEEARQPGQDIGNCTGPFREAVHHILSYTLRQNERARHPDGGPQTKERIMSVALVDQQYTDDLDQVYRRYRLDAFAAMKWLWLPDVGESRRAYNRAMVPLVKRLNEGLGDARTALANRQEAELQRRKQAQQAADNNNWEDEF